MTKKEINEEVRKAWNSTRYINGFGNIAIVGWKNNGNIMVVENDDTFQDCLKDDFVPILSFETRKELIDYIYRYTRHGKQTHAIN
jgi:hypothetical protein